MSGSAWARLSSDDQQMFRDVFRQAAERGSLDIHQQEQELIPWFQQQGIKVHRVDRAPFAEAVKPMLTGKDVGWTADQYQRLEALE